MKRVLITGASIAGCAAVWWLARVGCEVVVAERAPAFRDGGQNVDVRGLAREVLRRMGLEEAALRAGTGEEGTAWVDRTGRVVAAVGVGDGGPTAEMEILRGDLAHLLFDAARDRADWRFGEAVATISQDAAGVDVTFRSERTERFDAVIVAEGVGSTTREMMFPGENRPRWMDVAIAYFTIPRRPDDDRSWRWFPAARGRSVSLRPDRHGTARAMLIQQGRRRDLLDWRPDQQKAWLRERFAGAGWQTGRVLDGMAETDDFYFDVLRQVRLPRWSNGRVVLLGDAAWCVTPLGGIGASLAVTGAAVLAGAMKEASDLPTAFSEFERFMRPLAARGQGVPKIAPRIMQPRTRIGVFALHSLLRLLTRPAVLRLASRFSGADRSDGPALPETVR